MFIVPKEKVIWRRRDDGHDECDAGYRIYHTRGVSTGTDVVYLSGEAISREKKLFIVHDSEDEQAVILPRGEGTDGGLLVDASRFFDDSDVAVVTGQEMPRCRRCLDRIDGAPPSAFQVPSLTCCPCCPRLSVGRCDDCDATTSLWVCMICGFVGCGRYFHGHAKNHYGLTGHALAIEISTHRVWDYSRDTYVHKLDDAPRHKKKNHPKQRQSKFVALVEHYERILEIQLSKQREHYEAVLARHHHKEENVDDDVIALDGADADLAALTARFTQLTDVATKARHRNHDALQTTDDVKTACARTRAHLTAVNADLYSQVSNLRAQIRDLDFYLRASEENQTTTDEAS